MIKRILAVIITILILPPSQAGAPACVVSGADVAAALTQAEAGPRCLELPAGIYPISMGLSASADNLEIRGAGEGLTILQVTNGLTLTQELTVLRLFGVGQRVHDLTIQLGSGYSGSGGIGGISVYGSGVQGAYQGRAERAEIDHVEITGGTTRGYGIGTYRLYTDNNAAQYVTIRDCYIHDTGLTGIVINSNNNLILHNHIARVGTGSLDHGIYAQGGYNLIDGNTVESASGYSFHGYKHVPNLDSSGDRYVNNISLNPGTGHMIIDGQPDSAGQPLDRGVVISGNVFRNTNGSFGSVNVSVPAIISDNLLENAAIGINPGADGTVVSHNRIAGTIPNGPTAIGVNVPAIIDGNTINADSYSRSVSVNGAGTRITNNRIVRVVQIPGTLSCFALNANGILISGNDITYPSGGQTIAEVSVITGTRVLGNRFVNPGGYIVYDRDRLGGVIAENDWTGATWRASANQIMRDNSGAVQ